MNIITTTYRTIKISGEYYLFAVEDIWTGKIMAEYRITGHHTAQGNMYIVHRVNEPDKAVWTDSLIKAEKICIADHKARVA